MKKLIFLKILVSIFLTHPFFAQAETVYVKYRGNVSLVGFSCVNTASSFVHRICYQSKNSYVVVLLDNTYYHYCNVPGAVVNQWLSSSSKGRFYRYSIKNNFDCRAGGVPIN